MNYFSILIGILYVCAGCYEMYTGGRWLWIIVWFCYGISALALSLIGK